MHLLALTCEALTRPVYYFAAQSVHMIDIELVRRNLHQPADIHTRLQQAIDAHAGEKLAGSLLGGGLGGQATAGLRARDIPRVSPRAHDCITLFLGSRERYLEENKKEPGTYWYSQDYLERNAGQSAALTMGASTGDDAQAMYLKYMERYGKAKADRLMQVMNDWLMHYKRAVYLDTGLGGDGSVEAEARQVAEAHAWAFERMPARLGLIQRLLNGDWEDDFLVVPPGQEIAVSFGEEIISSRAGGRAEGDVPSPLAPPPGHAAITLYQGKLRG